MPDSTYFDDLLAVTAHIVSSFVTHNAIRAAELPELVSSVRSSLMKMTDREPAAVAVAIPAVPIKKSITVDYMICLEDGKKLKTLKRHLHKAFGLTPEEYRAKWGLPGDYPMVAPGYSVRRAELAKASAFGNYRKRTKIAPPAAEEVVSGPSQAAAKPRARSLRKAA